MTSPFPSSALASLISATEPAATIDAAVIASKIMPAIRDFVLCIVGVLAFSVRIARWLSTDAFYRYWKLCR
jgi:hypothetical protein